MPAEDTESLLVSRLASILDQNPRLHSILHSRGVDIQGTFTASPTARELTDAPAFDGRSKRFTGRLSGTLGGEAPQVLCRSYAGCGSRLRAA